MQSFLSCNRCRGRKMGWDGRYILHQVICEQWVSKSSKLLILTVILASVIFGFSAPRASVSSGEARIPELIFPVSFAPVLDPAVGMIETFLQRHQVNPSRRTRVAESIVSSARKYSLDPKLIASIMIVESRADPFAISAKDSIGIMQIHLPTWGPIAHREGVNLFRIEENVDFGARILRDYIAQFGLWEGVKRYKGWIADDPYSARSVEEYLAKIQRTYGIQPTLVQETDFLE